LPALKSDLARALVTIGILYCDRGYIASDVVRQLVANGNQVICRPWQTPDNEGRFTKDDFKLDLRAKTITCPNGQTQRFQPGTQVKFTASICDRCPLRDQCTPATKGIGRRVWIGEDEPLQKRLRRLAASPEGRAQLRERVPVEHRLAHIGQRQGPRARYLGVRKNNFDLRRVAALQNLETAQRVVRRAA
jgi:hypothetical protein